VDDQDRVNILLVDDQPAKLMSYEVILSELGEQLIKATSARQALEHLLRNDVAVILIDVHMPELDGFELAQMIREHPRYRNTAIIFVSAVHLTEFDRLRGYQAGAVDYVPVPVVPELLRAKVRVFADLYRKTCQLERMNEELERRVAERTAALSALNEELERRIEDRTQEREAALAQLFEAQKLDTIGQLTGGVAHDFNNLLMAVLGSLNLLRKRLPEDERSKRLLSNAIEGAERGAALTRRLLAFARRQELKPEAIDVAKLVAGMEDLLRRSLGPAIAIGIDIPEGLPRIEADSNQVELALLNLALNARDAMRDGGRLSLSAGEHVSAGGSGLQAGRYVRLTVSDTGEGMDRETLARATEPFFTTKGAGKGTGLGLSMVHGLAAQSGGALALRSAPGEGTTAELLLPVAPAETAAAAAPLRAAAPAPDGSALEVLVVDDDPLVGAGTADMLEDLGHAVELASSAREALEILSAGRSFDLVITDHAMPGMTGLQLAESLRESRPGLPVVLATGYADLPASGELAALSRLSKPFTQDELAAAICAAMRSAPRVLAGDRRAS
jgi:signal transduction histidine kinase